MKNHQSFCLIAQSDTTLLYDEYLCRWWMCWNTFLNSALLEDLFWIPQFLRKFAQSQDFSMYVAFFCFAVCSAMLTPFVLTCLWMWLFDRKLSANTVVRWRTSNVWKSGVRMGMSESYLMRPGMHYNILYMCISIFPPCCVGLIYY